MTKEEFVSKYLESTNVMRERLREPFITEEMLQSIGFSPVVCGCKEETCPGWAMKVGLHKRRISYDALVQQKVSLSGWSFEDLLQTMLYRTVREKCEPLAPRTECLEKCVHKAAKALVGLIMTVEHPENCPDCAKKEPEESSAKG